MGDAIGARASKAKGYTAKERSRDMETFLTTGVNICILKSFRRFFSPYPLLPQDFFSPLGRFAFLISLLQVHPEVERVKNASSGSLPQLPDSRVTRPRIFLDVSINRKDVGRIVIELYSDITPAPALLLQGRCTGPSGGDSLAGTRIHKILPGMAIFGGRSAKNIEAVQMKREASLRHVEPGVVSISNDATEICIALSRALHLDETYQVVGRVTSGMDVVKRISAVPITAADDKPVYPVIVRRCGSTNAAGTTDYDVVEAGGDSNEKAAEDLEKDVTETRRATHEALQAGLKRKAGGPAAGAAKKKHSALDAVLLGGSSSDDISDGNGSASD